MRRSGGAGRLGDGPRSRLASGRRAPGRGRPRVEQRGARAGRPARSRPAGRRASGRAPARARSRRCPRRGPARRGRLRRPGRWPRRRGRRAPAGPAASAGSPSRSRRRSAHRLGGRRLGGHDLDGPQRRPARRAARRPWPAAPRPRPAARRCAPRSRLRTSEVSSRRHAGGLRCRPAMAGTLRRRWTRRWRRAGASHMSLWSHEPRGTTDEPRPCWTGAAGARPLRRGPRDRRPRRRRTQTWRAGRDELLATHPDSPLLPEDRAGLHRRRGWRRTTRRTASRSSSTRTWSRTASRCRPATDGVVPFERIGVLHLPELGDLDVWWLGVVRRRGLRAGQGRAQGPADLRRAGATCWTRSRAPTSVATSTSPPVAARWSST